ncbi:hypothetical protein KPL70_004592 [Citrus sinensis]|uniref:Bromo domain-containing protein n=3 Tax=Citrus TaxID=2706 RepID=A0A067GEW3_CITSI|nr:transcription factor GTE1 isoform X2 [Citrus sinensis]KAH9747051.1 hypothetical protein KPL70_004592 [Citrus sinensis]KAH9795374.1 hypothetical protein KPL71_005191 [Citrus sinensis]KDO77165.1 hypothetical protein CISIN_1g015200mg [Citrus sinensis]KDO77166.1 hypothetical protein CISIN_1g015200mg [Citrus sinensis]
MEPMSGLNQDLGNVGLGKAEGDTVEVEGLNKTIDDILQKVTQLEQKLNDVEQFYLTKDNNQPNTSKSISIAKEKLKDRHVASIEKQQQDAFHREEAAGRRMQELKRQFAAIFRQITQHKWAWPFMHPVDVEGLGLHDYYEVIEKPMDFSTIKNKMDGKDGTGYRNVREIYADVRLVFKNAMKYNDERDDVHVMAKSLLEKFEEKWLQLLPKVMEEEKRQEEEEAKAQLDMQLTQEAVQTNKAKELRSELNEVDMQLENLRETVIQKCRKMSTEEKKNLGTALTRLSPEDLCKALEIVAENNPSFHATAQEVDLDMDAQSELTLWRLKVFVQESLKAASRSSGDMGGNNNNNNDDNNNEKDNSNKKNKNNPKRKKEICDALAKPAVKRTKKLPPNT